MRTLLFIFGLLAAVSSFANTHHPHKDTSKITPFPSQYGVNLNPVNPLAPSKNSHFHNPLQLSKNFSLTPNHAEIHHLRYQKSFGAGLKATLKF